jgi:hypothetical protein
MKNRFIYLIFIPIVMLMACGDLNDIQQKYLDEEPIVYLGTIDSLTAYSGKDRVKLTWYLSSDPRLDQTIIYWNQRKDSVVVDITRTNDERQKDSVFISVPEGTYTFEVINRGEKGEISVKQEIQGQSYGDVYEGTLRSRPLNNVSLNASISGATLTWDSQVNKTRIGTEVRYRNTSSGEWETYIVPEKYATLDLSNTGNELWNPDDIIYITGLHCPAGCIDTLRTRSDVVQFATYTVVSGVRKEFTAAGAAGAVTNYALPITKHFWYFGSNKNLLFSDYWGAFSLDLTLSTSNLTLNNDNTITNKGLVYAAGGVTVSYTILDSEFSSGKKSTYDPATKNITLYSMRKVAASGAYTVMEEVLAPVSTNP